MARPRRIKKDSDAHYHLMSRTNDRRFLFGKGEVKSELVSVLRRAAEFCGIELKAYAVCRRHRRRRHNAHKGRHENHSAHQHIFYQICRRCGVKALLPIQAFSVSGGLVVYFFPPTNQRKEIPHA